MANADNGSESVLPPTWAERKQAAQEDDLTSPLSQSHEEDAPELASPFDGNSSDEDDAPDSSKRARTSLISDIMNDEGLQGDALPKRSCSHGSGSWQYR